MQLGHRFVKNAHTGSIYDCSVGERHGTRPLRDPAGADVACGHTCWSLGYA